MKIQMTVVGAVETNCYFAINEEINACVLIDPGDEAQRLKEKLTAAGLKPEAILLTHAHFDHIMAVNELAESYGIPVYVHADDAVMLGRIDLNCGAMFGARATAKADKQVKDGDCLQLAGMEVQVFHTPGHTPGGVCYYFPQAEVLFSGDTLFCESVGRTDFPGGSMSQLVRSIREKLFTLPDLTIVYPGHGEPTNISTEKQYNPFL